MSVIRHRTTRRNILGGLALAGAASALPSSAFAGPRASTRRRLALQDAASTSFMNWDAMEGTVTEAAILAYQEQSGNPVEIIPTPGTGTDYETKVRTMLAGGTVPDIIRTNDDFVRFYSSKEQFTDLQPLIERDGISPDDFYEPIWNFAKQPTGKYTAVSLGNQPRLIYYNVDMFNEAGIPLPPKDWSSEGWTWDDFVEIAKALTVEGEHKTEGSLICYAIPTAAKNPEGAWELLKFLAGADGSKIFADGGEFVPAFKGSAETITAEGGENPASMELFATAMDHNTNVHFTEYTENARNVYRPQLDLVWTGESTAEEVLTGVRQEIEEILSGAF